MKDDPAMQSALCALLNGREERARLQAFSLSGFDEGCICQISLNIPGLPKKMEGEAKALSLAAGRLTHVLERETAESTALVNGAGTALLLIFPHISPLELKKNTVEIEESADWCRVLDIDVISHSGAVSRRDLGLPPRRCLLCKREAKLCARLGAHSIQDLREVSARLLSRSFNSTASIR